jgi:hypothetical protein
VGAYSEVYNSFSIQQAKPAYEIEKIKEGERERIKKEEGKVEETNTVSNRNFSFSF